MNPTLTESRAALHALLRDATGVDVVLDNEPIHETPASFFASLSLERVTPEDQVWQVRIYISYRDAGETAAYTLDAAIEGMDDQLYTSSQFGPATWEVGVVEDIFCWVAKASLTRGREDF